MNDPNPNTDATKPDASAGVTPGRDATGPRPPHAGTSPLTAWQKFKLIFKVVEIRLRFVAILVAVGLFVGYWDTIKNHWEKQTRSDGGVYRSVRVVLGEQTAHRLWPQGAVVGAGDSDTEFYCPMHPQVIRPGLDPNGAIPKCPICGMPLSLRNKGEAPELPEGVLSRKQFSPDQVQMAGIRTVEVTYRPLEKEITAVGYVSYDESQRSHIVVRVSGYLEKLYVDKPWITVDEGEALGEIYSPELYSAARELLIGLKRNSSSSDLVESSREKLRLLGISDGEIDEIVKSGKANHRLVLRAPISGHLIRKDVREGSHVEAGQMLFEVADLSKVWIEAEVYEADVAFPCKGQAMEATVEAFPGTVFTGTVSLVHPHLDAATRTNAVRFELENPGHKLRPGMFATVRMKTPLRDIEPFHTMLAENPLSAVPVRSAEPHDYFACPSHPDVMMDRPGDCPKCGAALAQRLLPDNRRLIWWCPMHPKVTADKPGGECEECGGMKLVPKLQLLAKEGEVLAVPARSVIDTGSKKIVYVERKPGLFEGVEVQLGPRVEVFYPVIAGLMPGDRIAERGAFLIDAETRLNPAAAAAYVGASGGPQSAPPASTFPSSRPAGATPGSSSQEHEGHEHKPMADGKGPSEEDRKSIAKLPPADRDLALAQEICPITGEPLGSMGIPYKVLVKGRAVFLCCKGCEAQAKKQPDKVLKALAPVKTSAGGKNRRGAVE